jgi:hypothetical protein
VNLKDSLGSESMVGEDRACEWYCISDVLCVKCGARSDDVQAEELSTLPNSNLKPPFSLLPH